MKAKITHPRAIYFLIAVLLLLALFAQQALSVQQKSVTVDEPAHLTRGYVYLRLGDLRFRLGHPVGMNALSALPLLLLDDLTLPTEHPSWAEAKWSVFDDQFFWRSGNNVEQMITLGRLPTMFLALLVASVVYRWAADLFGPRAGLLALLLCVFSPNFVAHTRLVTTDLGQTAGFFLTAFLFWRFLRRPSWPRLLFTGLAFGLAQTIKFSTVLLLPILGLTALLRLLLSDSTASQFRFPAEGPFLRRARDMAGALAVIGMVGFVALWAVYGFELRPALNLDFPIPAATHFEEFDWVMEYFDRPHTAYLNGQTSNYGWWYYFFVTFLLKTPLPLLLLGGWGLIASLRGGRWRRAYPITVQGTAEDAGNQAGIWRLGDGNKSKNPLIPQSRQKTPHFGTPTERLPYPLLVPIAVYWAASLTTSLNIGHRHLLPVLPFLFVLTGRVVECRKSTATIRNLRYAIFTLLIAWYVFGTLRIYPHYLAYFNELAGGAEGGPRYLVDSNIDWGQDLPALRRWMSEHNLDSVYLSYFGTAHPSAYGVDFVAIPTWEPALEKGNPFQRVFLPSNPAPGYYALSVTNLFGPMIADDETFAWFRERDPVARIGYSIYVYQVEPTGPPADLALSGLQIDELAPEAIARFGTNDLRLRWFDARHSLVFPASGEGWYVVSEGTPPAPALADRFWADAEAAGDHLYRLSEPGDLFALKNSPVWWSPATAFPEGFERHGLSLPVDFGLVELLGYEIVPAGDGLKLLTWWRVGQSSDRPLKLFAHLLDAGGQVATGQDRLDVPTAGWREGDILVQIHYLLLPEGAAAGSYQLEIGWYDTETMQRLPVRAEESVVADRVLLEPIIVFPR